MLNTFAIAIILMLGIKFLVNFIAELLNVAALNREVPDEFKEVFDKASYRKAQDYTAATTKFRLLKSSFDLAVLFIFWFSGGFSWLDVYVRAFGLNSLFTGLVYVGVLMAASILFSLPFAIYITFVIEERFGLNRTTVATFVLDRIKGILLGVLIGGSLLASILWLFEFGGESAWVYAWAVMSVAMVILLFIAPRFLMPLFYKFTLLEDGELKAAIYALAGKLKFPLSGIYVIDGSRRSSKANAFFSGFGKHKRIALFDTLIAGSAVPELVAVLAHEIGHYKKKHSILGLAEIEPHPFYAFINYSHPPLLERFQKIREHARKTLS
ncbi:MAG: STE24 endopeptidase [Parcubacteria group bacterium Gr01-1014_44]|nr:MAG: STE24 endopeptidase [Parcubacteria group bacterium Gr01-1014_44]